MTTPAMVCTHSICIRKPHFLAADYRVLDQISENLLETILINNKRWKILIIQCSVSPRLKFYPEILSKKGEKAKPG